MVQSGVSIASAALAVLVVRALTERQQQGVAAPRGQSRPVEL